MPSYGSAVENKNPQASEGITGPERVAGSKTASPKKIDESSASDKAGSVRPAETTPREASDPLKEEETFLPDASGYELFDPPTKEQFLASMREYYAYRISGYQHRRQVLEWQLFSSKIIFIVVNVLVLAGISFSGIQFYSSFKRAPANISAPKAEEAAKAEAAGAAAAGLGQTSIVAAIQESSPAETLTTDRNITTEIEASMTGIKVSSPVLGVIILVISFLFYYLYLVYVYPAHNIF